MGLNEKFFASAAASSESHFEAVLYTGDGNTTAQPVTGVGFKPDLVWIKTRNQNTKHLLTDSVRGVSSQLFSNEVSAASNYSEFNSFDDDGFTVKRNSSTDYFNQSGINYVAWCFKAGGVPSGSNKISIDGTSYANEAAAGLTAGSLAVDKLSVNNNLGFSVIKVVDHTTTKTIAHGLDSAPEMIIKKPIDSSSLGWYVYHKDLGNTKYLNLDTNSAAGTNNFWNDTSPTGSILTSLFSNTAYDMLYYCFTSKTGVSKVGSYTGGAAGNKIDTGFEPAFVMVKYTGGNSSWEMYDNARGITKKLWANESSLEATNTSPSYIQFNTDGFEFPITSGGSNSSGRTYIYYAVA